MKMTFGGAAEASEESNAHMSRHDLRTQAAKGTMRPMTATLTLDEAGRLILPEAAVQALGVKPGAEVKAEVTRYGIELLSSERDDVPVITEFTPDGLPVMPKGVGPITDREVIAAIKAGRDERDRRVAGR